MTEEIAENRSAKPSIWRKTYRISLRLIVFLLIVVIVFSVFLYNVEAHSNWDLMREEAVQYGLWMNVNFTDFLENNTWTANTNEISYVQFHLDAASGCLEELAATDPQHAQQLFLIQNFLSNLESTNTYLLNDTSRAILKNDLDGLTNAIPNAYYNSGGWSSDNTDNGAPPFWYFNTDPCNETTLQNAVVLAEQGNAIINNFRAI